MEPDTEPYTGAYTGAYTEPYTGAYTGPYTDAHIIGFKGKVVPASTSVLVPFWLRFALRLSLRFGFHFGFQFDLRFGLPLGLHFGVRFGFHLGPHGGRHVRHFLWQRQSLDVSLRAFFDFAVGHAQVKAFFIFLPLSVRLQAQPC